jgi:hypothetical protein
MIWTSDQGLIVKFLKKVLKRLSRKNYWKTNKVNNCLFRSESCSLRQ